MAVIALEIYFGAKLNPKTGRTFCEIFIYNLKSGRIVCACSKVVNHNLSGVKYKLNYQFYRFFNFSNFYFVDKDKNVLLQEEGFCCMAKMGTIVNRNIWFLNSLQNLFSWIHSLRQTLTICCFASDKVTQPTLSEFYTNGSVSG